MTDKMRGAIPRPIYERFWEKVDSRGINDCWNWTAYISTNGYGIFGENRNKNVGAHRKAWELTNGKIPNKLCVLHKCDNRKCVNPSHLFLGSHSDNTRDMDRKGRRGKKKLSIQDVLQIKKALSVGVRQITLANKYCVSRPLIAQIKAGTVWPLVKEVEVG